MIRAIMIDGEPVDFDDAGPVRGQSRIDSALEAFFTAMINDCTDLIDWLCSIPPLSWLDAALRGFVGPRD